MKKSILYLSVTLLTFSTATFATNVAISPINVTSIYAKNTPLCIAIQKGEIDIVKKLIEYGADVNEKSFGMTPLMVAARYNKVEIMKLLISKGAVSNTKDEKGFTALKYAELSNATGAIELLKTV